MGGIDNHSNQTTTLPVNGKNYSGFDLVEKSIYSCAIEDPKSDSIIVTGGFDDSNSKSSNLVIRYGKDGFIEYLPRMKKARYLHGCAGYYNSKKQLVSFR